MTNNPVLIEEKRPLFVFIHFMTEPLQVPT